MSRPESSFNPLLTSAESLLAQPRTILIRSTNWIGDAIMTTPAVRTIRENFPQATISMLAWPWVADVFAASPHIDEILLYNKNGEHAGLPGMARLTRMLRERRFECAILLQNAFEAALIAFGAAIPVRAGYTTDGRGLLLTHGVRLRAAIKNKHQVYYYQQLLQGLGLRPGANELFLRLPEESRCWAQQQVRPASGPLIGLNPGGTYGPAKRWPAEKFARLAGRLHTMFGATLAVLGTSADGATAQVIKSAAPKGVLDFTGRTSLTQAMALISRCDAFVTNDSGLMHVGAALDIPLVAIFGSTNPKTTGPFSRKACVVRKEIPCSPCLQSHCPTDFRCMEEIGVDEVMRVVERILVKNN
ncbi:MAG: lipopolysaccharide heptosyltransferase II [Desulfobacteraceae bacterium]|nr:MAG: lipopolysaccharide heptosyltransferase II [Desulfobacteraceae bacterium]